MPVTKIVSDGDLNIYVLEYTERNGQGALVIFKNGDMEFVCSEGDFFWLHDGEHSGIPMLVEVKYLNEELVQLSAKVFAGAADLTYYTYEEFVLIKKSEYAK